MLQEEEARLARTEKSNCRIKNAERKGKVRKGSLRKTAWVYVKQKEAAIEKEFRNRLSSEASDKSFNEENLGKLTDRQIHREH